MLFGKDNGKQDVEQLDKSLRLRIQEFWIMIYGKSEKWVQEFKKGPFPMTEVEWIALFLNPNGCATLWVIQIPATVLN